MNSFVVLCLLGVAAASVPLDTPEVAAAKAAHLAAHAAARSGAHWSPYWSTWANPWATPYAASWAHGNVLGLDGLPRDTPEVAAAKAAHLAAHGKVVAPVAAVAPWAWSALPTGGYTGPIALPPGYDANGAPLPVQDTPEVAAAKASHLAAHAGRWRRDVAIAHTVLTPATTLVHHQPALRLAAPITTHHLPLATPLAYSHPLLHTVY